MEMTLPAIAYRSASGEIIETEHPAFLTACYPAGSTEHGTKLDQTVVNSLAGQGAVANRSIFYLVHQPHPGLSEQPFFWSSAETTEEPAPQSMRLPPDANQESAQPTPQIGAWVREVSERFDYLLALPSSWDGHDAAPIKSEHLLAVGRFLSAVMAPETEAPAIVPTADGGVQIEWHQGGVDVEVLFSDCDDDAIYVHDIASGKEWEGPAIEGFAEFELETRLAA